MSYECLALVPPLVVVILAGFTKNVRLSVGVAIVTAGLIACHFSVGDALVLIAQRFWAVTELGNLQSWQAFQSSFFLFVCLFLLLLGIIIELIQVSGGAYAYGRTIIARLKSVQNAERASLLLSCLFAIDDYFSSLTVGTVMRPISDQFKIARVKLALLVNVLASPFAIIFPLSSWGAHIIGQLRQAGIAEGTGPFVLVSSDPFYLYLKTIPFLFYAFIAVGTIWFIVQRRLSFGIVAKHEAVAAATGNLFAGKIPVMRQVRKGNEQFENASIFDFLLPILVLVFSVVGFILFGGDYDNIPAALFKGSIGTVVVTLLFFLVRGRITLVHVGDVIKDGIKLMAPALVVVLFIWTLSSLLQNDLKTGAYLAQLIGGRLPVVLLPTIFFFTAVIISASMASAWGTIGTLIPIGVPMLVSLSILVPPVDAASLPLLLPLLGAIISGAASGNHLSPVADVMFMSATSAGAYHLDLVKAQVSFAVPTVCSSGVAFLVASYLISFGYGMWVTLPVAFCVGLFINIIIMSVLHYFSNRS